MNKPGVPPLNVVVSCCYIAIATLACLLLKRANRSGTRLEAQQGTSRVLGEEVNLNKLMVVSWLKKYTLIGGFFARDNKYLLKQFLFVSTYAVACLGINRIIVWPAGLGIVVLVGCFLVVQVMVKKAEAKSGKEVSEVRPNLVNNVQAQSELQIQSVNIEPRVNIFVQPVFKPETAKITSKLIKTPVQTVSVSLLCFASVVMLLRTVMTLSTSISNSGQLNICSVLIIILIDQLAIRLPLGVTLLAGCRLYLSLAGIKEQESSLVFLLCSEEITDILIEREKERVRKELQMAAPPPRKKKDSPSRVPKAVAASGGERPSTLNLISLQPTTLPGEEEQIVEQIYLTTVEKDLFELKDVLEQKNGFYTKRFKERGNAQFYCHSAQKGTTVDMKQKKEFDDILILKDDPFDEAENHPGQFCLEDSVARYARRKGVPRKRNKRNLQLNGSSPYLEYLPDMLKKVDKYKQIAANKENNASKAIR